MLFENCKPGVKVKILSKSVGMRFERLGYDETTIERIIEETEDGSYNVICDEIGNYFYADDLEPLWEKGD